MKKDSFYVQGQPNVTNEINKMLEQRKAHPNCILSHLILKGPAGAGKTVLTVKLAEALSEIDGETWTVVDIPATKSAAGIYRELVANQGTSCIYFIDEVHGMAKAALYSLLPVTSAPNGTGLATTRDNKDNDVEVNFRRQIFVLASNYSNKTLAKEEYRRRFKTIEFERLSLEDSRAILNTQLKDKGYNLTVGALNLLVERSKSTPGDLVYIAEELVRQEYSDTHPIKPGEIDVSLVKPFIATVLKRWPKGLDHEDVRALNIIMKGNNKGERTIQIRSQLNVDDSRMGEILMKLESAQYIVVDGNKSLITDDGKAYMREVIKLIKLAEEEKKS